MNNTTKLYTLDSKDRIRIWEIVIEKSIYYTRDYIENGKIKDWIPNAAIGKNIGKSNATTNEEQAALEAQQLIDRKLKENYFYTIEEAKSNKEFRPMLAHKYEDYGSKLVFPVISQPKLDGARCNAVWDKKENKVVLKTRTGGIYVSCPHIEESLHDLLKQNQSLILDGELYNHELKNDFEKLMSLIRKSKPTQDDLNETKEKVFYFIYDCHILGSALTFSNRSSLVQAIPTLNYIKIVPSHVAHDLNILNGFYTIYLENGYEGQMVRAVLSTYKVDGRSKDLLKRKEFHDEEFEIIDIEEGTGAWIGKAKKVTVRLKNGELCGCGLKGTFEQCEKILINKDSYIGKLATVTYFEKTGDGQLRFPVIKDLNRHDF